MKGSVEGNSADSSGMTAEGAFDGDQGRMNLTTTQSGAKQETEIAHDGTVFYVDPPAGTDVPQGKDWIKIDVSEFSPGTSDLSGFLQFMQADPLEVLRFIGGGLEDVEEVGKEEVRGVETTHYRGTVNLEEAAEASESLGDVYARLIENSEFKEFPAELWIDEDGVTRRLTYEIPISTQRGGGTATLEVEFYDFGTEVEVAPPSDEDAFDLGEAALTPTTTGVGP